MRWKTLVFRLRGDRDFPGLVHWERWYGKSLQIAPVFSGTPWILADWSGFGFGEGDRGDGRCAQKLRRSNANRFCTVSENYTFNVDAVKLKRKVMAPYTDEAGSPKDWDAADDGNFRLTHPSNLWTDITVPFWSMPENTDHPTQKPEKLVAKMVLASSNPGNVVLDPFLGSGTTSVVAKKLGRKYVGIELENTYCCLAEPSRVHEPPVMRSNIFFPRISRRLWANRTA
jgi:hypothetical protein